MSLSMWRSSRHLLPACAIISQIFSTVAIAAIVHGTVTDPLGAPVAGAAVALVQNGKVVTNTHSDAAGGFTLSCGTGGRFYVLAASPTFRQVSSQSFYAGKLDNVQQDVVLETATVRQNIVVTATGLEIPQAQTSASVTVLQPADFANRFTLVDPLRQVPGVNVVTYGQNGSATSIFVRGGNSDANRFLIDGVPAEDIGGRFDLGNVSTTGIGSVEAFRGSNSVLYGSDAAAGVFSLTTPRGSTPTPSFFYQGDAGSFYTYRNEFQSGGTRNKLDYFGAFSRLNSSNDIALSPYHNVASSLNLGWAPTARTQIRATARNTAAAIGLPGAYDFYQIANDGKQSDQNLYVSTLIDNQTSDNWHNMVRYGLARKREQAAQWYPAGIPISFDFGYGPTDYYFGQSVLIKGANGYAVTGQAILNYPGTYPNFSDSSSNRDQLYAQSDYRLTPHLTFLGAFRYEDERGSYNYPAFGTSQALERPNFDYTAQFAGDFKNRFFYQAGGGIQKNHVYGVQGTPRASATYYIQRPGSGLFHGTKVNFNFAKGVKEPSLSQQFSSLYDILLGQPGGAQTIEQESIYQIGAERTRSYDGGVEQSILNEKMLVKGTYFHNEFGSQIEFIDPYAIPQLLPNLSPAEQQSLVNTLVNTSGGAYANSLSFRAQGFESEVQYQPRSNLFFRGGYTYLDAKVQRSFTSDAVGPSFNTGLPGGAPPSFSNVPIGNFDPLVGARPFRRPPHSGFLSATYTQRGITATLTSAYASRSDDSTYLGGSDVQFTNSLLLPNRNLDYGYQRVNLGLTYQLNSWLALYSQTNNLFNQGHIAPIGYPSLPFTVQTGLKVALGGHPAK